MKLPPPRCHRETRPRLTPGSAVQVDEPRCSGGSRRAKGNKSEVAGKREVKRAEKIWTDKGDFCVLCGTADL